MELPQELKKRVFKIATDKALNDLKEKGLLDDPIMGIALTMVYTDAYLEGYKKCYADEHIDSLKIIKDNDGNPIGVADTDKGDVE